MSRTLLAVVGVLALLAGFAPAGAHPLTHGGAPRVVNLRPAPGHVVPAGAVTVAALAIAGANIASQRVLVDGREVTSTRSGESATHQTVAATVDLPEGDHIAEVIVSDASGRRGARAWRFTVTGLTAQRLSGEGRVETAVAVSRELYPAVGSARAAVLARADDFPDALAGVPFAQSADAPLLLSARDALSRHTADELQRILLPGAPVYLLGGTSALSDAVAQDVSRLGFIPERVRGEDRYATAAELARRLPPSDTAVVVSGRTFADALSASSPAAVRGYPVLLAAGDILPEPTRAALVDRDVTAIVVVGGTKAVGADVEAQLRRLAPDVTRISGPSRYDTAAAVARAFLPDADVVGVANGENFPDALAGGRHAAAHAAPLVLTPGRRMLPPQVSELSAREPRDVVVYGGTAAVHTRAVDDVRRAAVDRDGPRLVSVVPGEGAEIASLDQVVVEFDRDLVVEHSQVYVTVGGNEVAGSIAIGDFTNTVVFTAAELPPVSPGVDYDVSVVGAVFDGDGWRHFAAEFVLHKRDLARGDSGPLVLDLQRRLEASGYWLGAADGVYGTLTHQAVMAFQKTHGLPRTGAYGPRTRALLESGPARPTPRSTSGLVIEVDKARQILLMVRNGHVEWTFNTSTGTEQPYTYEGRTYLADTPPGRWRINRQIDGVRESNLGRLYRPKYFHPDGIAVHGSSSVPAYPASHGCVRVTNQAMDWFWGDNRLPLGTPVWVY